MHAIMIYNILQYLEKDAELYPDKIALKDEFGQMTYLEYAHTAQVIGSFISEKIGRKTGVPVAVLIDRNIESLCCFMGVVYSGNFYVPVDTTMPQDRIQLIFQVLQPVMVIDARSKTRKPDIDGCFFYQEIVSNSQIDTDNLLAIRNASIDLDPLYAIFTSGSTGVPKGVVISHRSVIDLVLSFEEAFSFSAEEVFGNQAPFDFDVSVKDIYNALYTGGTVFVIPKRNFKTPKLLVGCLREQGITTIIWAVSAMRIISDFRALEDEAPLPLHNIMFSGEVMPVRALKYWKSKVKEARYVNLYGPTEITCNCTYYVIPKDASCYQDDDMIPIGKAFKNCRVFLKGEDEETGIITNMRQIGEICVTGSCLALGYWNNAEKTNKVFTADPTVSSYEKKIYMTGDLGYYDENGDLVFASRRDHQIKHMGHRIELGEIEAALNSIPFLTVSCCTYDNVNERIICHYQAELECKKDIVLSLAKKLPKYMWPNIYIRYDALPLNKNGKIDRVLLSSMVKGSEQQH